MKLVVEAQVAEITDETRARISMVRLVLRATLFALQQEIVDKLAATARSRGHGSRHHERSGDCGTCFE